MSKLSSHPKHVIFQWSRRIFFLLSILILIGAAILLQPKGVFANPEDGLQDGVAITNVDTSNLSPSNPIVTVWIKNHDLTQSHDSTLELSYLLFPTTAHGKSWNNLKQLNFSSEFENLASIQIRSLGPGEVQAVDFPIRSNMVASLSRVPGIFMGELFSNVESTRLSHQIGFAFPKDISMIHTTALAFDNPNYAVGNLAPQIESTVNGIINGSEINQELFSIMLVDDFGEGDSQIYFVYSGMIIPARSIFGGLPDAGGNLSEAISEYDMGDGETLGGYLKWVRQVTNNQKLTFSFYGHGGALMPEIEPSVENLVESTTFNGSGPITMPSWVLIQPSWVLIQPSWVLIQPSWVLIQPTEMTAEQSFATDSHPASLISVKDLATALKKGSNNGENPIDVVDLVHCFSLSIEEVYELAPYAKTIIGSANYHFFDVRMPGKALANINAEETAENIATTIMTTYDNVLPSEGYPRTMAVIDGAKVADIKTYWDQTAAALLDAFTDDHANTRNKLQQAYFATTKYDSTSCDNEFSIKSPDALVDFYEFTVQLQNEFRDDVEVAQSIQRTSAQIDSAVIAVVNRSGTPWFGSDTTTDWHFNGKGLAIFADLVGQPDGSGRYALSWQSAFYNRTPHEYSPNPFDFVMSDNGEPTWADVLLKSWEGFEVSAQGCPVFIPSNQDQAEIQALELSVSGNTVSADFNVDRHLGNLIMLFEVVTDGEVVYFEEVHTGWLDSGNHTIVAEIDLSNYVLESEPHDVQLSVSIDPHGYIAEENKTDNQLALLFQP
ncbi:MAG: clostripain-related cysteine peptidase [Anaerolineae bacterium]